MEEINKQFTFQKVNQKLTDWKNEPDLQILKGDLEAAKPSQSAQIAKIEKWNNYLKVEGSAKPPKIRGRSSVQPKLIRRQAEWRYSALSEAFLSSNKLFDVKPVTFEDEEGAQQNELVLNWQFRTKLNLVKFIDEYVRAVVNDGTCIVRVGWERQTKPVKVMAPRFEFFEITDEEQMALFEQALELRESNYREFDENADEAVKAAVEYFLETGRATYAIQVGEEEIEEEEILQNEPTVQILNPANVYIDPSCEGDMNKALFVITSFETNKAELLKQKDRYKNLDKINWEGSSPLAQPDHVTNTPDNFAFKDESRKKIVAYEYWGYYDIEGNGELVPIVATWVDDVLIRMEKSPFPDGKLPFVVVPYMPIVREVYGEPDAELLEDNQDILGAVMRGLIDLLGRSANGQIGFAKGMLDPLNRRRYDDGKDYEFNPNMPPQTGIIEHKFPEIPNSALQMLNLQNQEAESLTGVKAFYGGLSGNAYGDIATGIRGMLDAAAKREMAILRRLAKGIIDIGKKIIAMNAEFLSEKEVIRVTNKEYVTVYREDLKGNYDLEVDISTFEVDNNKAQDLGFMLQTLGPNMDPQIYMMILSEIAKLKRMPVLAETLRRWRPEPNPIQEQLQQLELLRVQTEIQKLNSEIQVNTAKAQELMAKANLTSLDTVEQETGTKHARKIIEQQAQARGNQDLEITKALLRGNKPGETPPDIDAAIGHTVFSDQLKKDELLSNDVPPNPNPNF